MLGRTIEVSTCAYTYMYLHVPPTLHHLYLHSIPIMCASLSCPSSSGSQADMQTDRTDRTDSSALASPLRSSAENENGPSFFPASASLLFPSLPFPPVDELDLTCFVWALPQNVIICVIAYPWMRERASTPHYLTCIT